LTALKFSRLVVSPGLKRVHFIRFGVEAEGHSGASVPEYEGRRFLQTEMTVSDDEIRRESNKFKPASDNLKPR
jgi:hypothetical protein